MSEQRPPGRTTGGTIMAQRTLWDTVKTKKGSKNLKERLEKESAKKQAIKRLRAGGHWLNLLRVARTIPQPFTLNDISVAVWRDCPDFFGMKGHPYPDNHKVHYILYGDRGLIAKGLIQRVSQGLFRVPDDVDPDLLLASADDSK